MTWRSRCSNSPFMLGAGLQQAEVERQQRRPRAAAAARRPRTMRSAKPSTTAVLPTPASPVRIGLFWRRRIRMSTICRISSSRPMIGSISPSRARSVRSTRELLQRFLLAHRRRGHGTAVGAGFAAAAGREPGSVLCAEHRLLRGAADLGEVLAQVIELDAVELARDTDQRVVEMLALQHADHEIAGANLGLAEHQSAVQPAVLDAVLDVIGKVDDRGRAARQTIECRGDVAGQRRRLELVVANDRLDVGAGDLHELRHPMDQLDVGIAAHLAEDRGALHRLVCNRVQLAEQDLTANSTHADSPCLTAAAGSCGGSRRPCVGLGVARLEVARRIATRSTSRHKSSGSRARREQPSQVV